MGSLGWFEAALNLMGRVVGAGQTPYDYAQEVSVTVLGRIFEQSISDLEQIASLGDAATFALTLQTGTPLAGGKKGVAGKRKRDGVVYTPDHITRFIVEQALAPTLRERFEQLHALYFIDSCWRKPEKGWRAISPKSVATEDLTEYQFWLAWQAALTRFRVCDAACGSGAFLVAAFDLLKEAYTQLHLKLRELAPEELLTIDISHEILTRNLFGVDINAESIEITKLSRWLKTAEQGRQLDTLEANFYQGNSLIALAAAMSDSLLGDGMPLAGQCGATLADGPTPACTPLPLRVLP